MSKMSGLIVEIVLSCNKDTLSRLCTTCTEYKHSHGQESKAASTPQWLLCSLMLPVMLNNGCCCTCYMARG